MLDFQYDFMLQIPLAINFNDPRRAGLGNHHAAVLQRLKRMHLDTFSPVAVPEG